VLAHIDYPVRSWPAEQAGAFDAADLGISAVSITEIP
jgi:hypothetical protein